MTFLPRRFPLHSGVGIQSQQAAKFEQLEPRVLFSAFPGAEGFGADSLGGRGDGSQTPQVLTVDTLEDVVDIDRPVLVALAVQVGKTRLIDNMILTPSPELTGRVKKNRLNPI